MGSLELDRNQAENQIRSYKPGAIEIGNKIYNTNLIVTATKIIENWSPASVEQLTLNDFAQVIELKPDILLLGTGSKHLFLPLELYSELVNHGIGVEMMDTRAACRTFNALTSENRNVVAALFIR